MGQRSLHKQNMSYIPLGTATYIQYICKRLLLHFIRLILPDVHYISTGGSIQYYSYCQASGLPMASVAIYTCKGHYACVLLELISINGIPAVR